jgi:hypothetical protein
MAYCNNCGSKIDGNDIFCANCGAKVNQKSNENKERIEQTFEHAKSITNQIDFSEIINTLKTSVLKPVSGGKQFVDKAQKNQVIIITIILAFLQGILGIWRINQISNSLQNIISNFYEDLSSLASLFGQGSSYNFNSNELESLNKTIDQFKYLITIPYAKIFIQNGAIYLIALLVLFIFIYLGISIFIKVKCTPLAVFKAVLISTIPIFTCEIISIVSSYFSLYLGIGFVILGASISIITLAIILKESLNITENPCVLIVAIAWLIALAVFFVVLQNFISSDLSDIVKTVINSYKSSTF